MCRGHRSRVRPAHETRRGNYVNMNRRSFFGRVTSALAGAVGLASTKAGELLSGATLKGVAGYSPAVAPPTTFRIHAQELPGGMQEAYLRPVATSIGEVIDRDTAVRIARARLRAELGGNFTRQPDGVWHPRKPESQKGRNLAAPRSSSDALGEIQRRADPADPGQLPLLAHDGAHADGSEVVVAEGIAPRRAALPRPARGPGRYGRSRRRRRPTRRPQV